MMNGIVNDKDETRQDERKKAEASCIARRKHHLHHQ